MVKTKLWVFLKKAEPKSYSKPTSLNNVHVGKKEPRKLKLKKKSEDNIINDVRNLFRLKKNISGFKTE